MKKLSMLSQPLSMVGGDNQQGLIQQFSFYQKLPQSPYQHINIGYLSIIGSSGI